MEIFEKGSCAGAVIKQVQQNGLLTSISTYNSDLYNNAWHYHVNSRISYVLKGGCSEKKREHYERLPGTVTFYAPGELHRIVQMGNSKHISLEIDDVFFKQYDLDKSLLNNSISTLPDTKFMLLNMYREMMQDDAYSITSLQMLLLSILESSASRNVSRRLPSWVTVVYQLMQDRWNENLSLQDLSKATGIHPVTISHYFPKYFSCTFGLYMRKLKVVRALDMIKTGNISLTNVAYECGFADQSHFIHSFKSMVGFTPANYKRL
jgi:AraC family transcriptional regulator